MEECVGPIISVADLPNLSVLDLFKCSWSESALMVMSVANGSLEGLKWEDDGDVACRKPR